jgi:hypothetical protein
MRFALLLAAAAATMLLTAPAGAETVTKQSVRGTRTVISSRDETGRVRTRITVEKRSFLDPGTQVFPGEQRYNAGPWLVWQAPGSSPQQNTAFDRRSLTLPGRFDLPFNDNPVGGPQ